MRMLVGAVLAVSALGFASTDASESTAELVTLFGEVRDATTADPIHMATLTVEGQTIAAQTNAEGAFMLRVTTDARPFEVTIRHHCYHTVRVEVIGRTSGDARRVDVGMPHNNEKHGDFSPPLGGCERR